MDTSRLLTAEEVAEKTGLNLHQVYRRLHRGDIPSTFGGRHGAQYMVDPDQLQQYMDAGQPLSWPQKDQTILSTSDVVRMTGFTAETVRAMCERGDFTYTRSSAPGSHLRIHRASVEEWLRKNTAD